MRSFTLFFCLAALPCAAQSGRATASGECNAVNTGNNNSFTIACGIGKQQGDALLQIVNRILQQQLDPTAVNAKLDELLRRTGDRTLTTAQTSAILRDLRQSPQSISVTLLGDREANAFGRSIVELLRNAGWAVTNISQIGVLASPAYGVQVAGSPLLLGALMEAGVQTSAVQSIPAASGSPAIMIALKPY